MISGEFFNHDVSRWVNEDVPTRHLYSARALALTSPGDSIQLPPDLKTQWEAITGHYQRSRLPHSSSPVWDLSWVRFSEGENRSFSVFLFDDVTDPEGPAARWFRERDPAWFGCVRYINSKNNFIRLAEKLGVPVPFTICADNKNRMDLRNLRFPCLLKPALSGRGDGIVRCSDQEELENALSSFPEQSALQLQEVVDASRFINLQYRIREKRLQHLAATEQILEGHRYSGSRYPSLSAPWDQVEPLAHWLAENGMKDIFGFDIAVTAGEIRYLALECNPRFNGASYPTLAARKLGINCWSFETFSTCFRDLRKINLAGLEFDPRTGSGILLLNWGTILIGKLGILLAGSEEEQEKLRARLKERL